MRMDALFPAAPRISQRCELANFYTSNIRKDPVAAPVYRLVVSGLSDHSNASCCAACERRRLLGLPSCSLSVCLRCAVGVRCSGRLKLWNWPRCAAYFKFIQHSAIRRSRRYDPERCSCLRASKARLKRLSYSLGALSEDGATEEAVSCDDPGQVSADATAGELCLGSRAKGLS